MFCRGFLLSQFWREYRASNTYPIPLQNEKWPQAKVEKLKKTISNLFGKMPTPDHRDNVYRPRRYPSKAGKILFWTDFLFKLLPKV